MAEIKIIGNVENTQQVSRFNSEDTNLLTPGNLSENFGVEGDYIELFLYDNNNNILDVDYNYRNFKLPSNSFLNPNSTLPVIEIDPIKDIQDFGYNNGVFFTQYSFFRRKFSQNQDDIFISEISSDRTEIRINSVDIPTEAFLAQAQQLINDLNSSPYQKYYLINFTPDIQQVVVNVAIDNNSVLLKLYEPLSNGIIVKDTLWLAEEIIYPYTFNIDLNSIIIPDPLPQLKGPNFDIDIDIKQDVPTGYQNYSSLVSSLTGSSYYRVLNYMNDASYDLNIDYTDFSNFINFSSAEKRLEIFYDKINQIESYNTDIDTLLLSTSALKNKETSSIKLKIDNIISNFDGFENYLYFESSSYSWPKTTDVKPYKNKFINKSFYQISTSSIWNFTHSLNEIPTVIAIYSGSGQLLTTQSSVIGTNTLSLTFNNTTSSGYVILSSPSAASWYNNYTSSANDYDAENQNRLYNVIPGYVKNDPSSYQPYYTFVDMIGHYFDNIWIYITSINELYNADNNLEKGVSKDLVYDALKSLGVKLYNSKGDDQFDDYIGGLNSGSSVFVDALPTFDSTSSYLNNIPKKDLLAESYKRIYHNLILLNKGKGTSVGLQNLITSFGITSSILQPKEFGGSTKVNEIKGFDNDKITVKNNTITGSVLSPFISLQLEPTASASSTSTDLHFVDLSFSPQNELNVRVSSSIASYNIAANTLGTASFNIDQYIGDPALMESSSYDALIQQNLHFISSSAAISGSGQRLDYKKFTELVKYFDNSLFKMLKDFVPARTNALTGITIKSPVLERNKVPVYQPDVTNQETRDAKYAGPTIKHDNTYNFSKLQGDKSSFYTGEISGSYIDVYDYFENSNPNPYLFPTTSLETDTTAYNNYLHSDFNVTLNNVSSSVVSVPRKKVETIYTNINGKIFSSGSEINSDTELQDSYLSLKGHQNSRYDGTRISSLKYNDYSSASLGYIGDNSYGKTAVIDHHTRKIGLFTQIQENLFFNYPKRNNVFLKYLVDESGSLTELNKKNKHWEEVQNIFKAGNNLVVGQFDSQKYGDQKAVDGNKAIYDSGYSYAPILYLAQADNELYFDYVGNTLSKLFKITTSGGFISGSSSNKYPISDGKIYNLFRKNLDNADPTYADGNVYYSQPSSNTFSTYSIQETGNQRFTANFAVEVTFPTINLSGSFTFNITKVGTPSTLLKSETKAAVSGFSTRRNTSYIFIKKTPSDAEYILPQDVKVYDGNGALLETLTSGTVLRQVVATPQLTEYDQNNPCNFILNTQFYVTSAAYNSAIFVPGCDNSNPSEQVCKLISTEQKLYEDIKSELSNTLYFNVSTDFTQFTINDKIGFEFVTGSGGFNTTNFTASVLGYNANSNVGALYNQLQQDQLGNNPFANDSSGTKPFISGSYLNSLVLNSSLSYFRDYLFLPTVSSPTPSTNTLYKTYGNIENTFSPKIGDYVAVYYPNGYFESSISNVYFDGSGKLNLDLSNELPSYLKKSVYVDGDVTKFLLLSKINDETNVVLQFNKTVDQPTSLGFIIPNNLHPDVLANIDSITKEVKQKLVDFNTPDLGSF